MPYLRYFVYKVKIGSLGNKLQRRFIREFSWDQHLWKEGKEAGNGQKEKLGSDAVSPKVSANPWRAVKLGVRFCSVLSWDKEAWPV